MDRHIPIKRKNYERKQCDNEGCRMTAQYINRINGLEFCSIHRIPGCVHSKIVCSHNGCNNIAEYNYLGGKSEIYCRVHCLKEMVNIDVFYEENIEFVKLYTWLDNNKSMHCIDLAINSNGQYKILYHVKYAKSEEYRKNTKKCKTEWLDIQSVLPGYKFNSLFKNGNEKFAAKIAMDIDIFVNRYHNLSQGIIYKKLFPDELIDKENLKSTIKDKCKYPGCNKNPLFNEIGEIKVIFCKLHTPIGFKKIFNYNEFSHYKTKVWIFNKCIKKIMFHNGLLKCFRLNMELTKELEFPIETDIINKIIDLFQESHSKADFIDFMYKEIIKFYQPIIAEYSNSMFPEILIKLIIQYLID